MKRDAFSLIELLIVIVILGILATYSTKMYSRNVRAEAINHILSMIRYTQNLALHDKKHDRDNAYWQRSFWRFQIWHCKGRQDLYYTIGTDSNYDSEIDSNESAIDPSNGKFLYWVRSKECLKSTDDALKQDVSPNVFLTQRYGINRVEFSACKIRANGSIESPSKHIGFDNYGRPIKGYTETTSPDYYGHIVEDCTITFFFKDNFLRPFTIVITKESGYAYLQENPNL